MSDAAPTSPRERILELLRACEQRLEALGATANEQRLGLLVDLGRVRRALGGGDVEGPLRAALDLAESLRDRPARRAATLELGGWLVTQGDEEQGFAALERALEAAQRGREPGAPLEAVHAACELAAAHARVGDPAEAEAALRRALDGLRAAPAARALVELRAGELAAARGDAARAQTAFSRALEALPGLPEPGLRLVVELLASEGLAGIDPRPPTAAELVALEPPLLAALLETAIQLARAAAHQRPAAALQAALRLTGAQAGELRLGDQALAHAGAEGLPLTLVARLGERSLHLALPAGRGGGRREALVARVLLTGSLEDVDTGGTAARVLAMLDRVLTSGLDLERLVTVAVDLAVEATGASRGFILLREQSARLGFKAARRKAGDDLVDPVAIVSRSLVREVFLTGRVLLLEDAASDPRHGEVSSVGARGLRSVLVAPIPDQDPEKPPAGVLYLDDPGTVGRFGAPERDVAIGFAQRLGTVLRAALQRDRERAEAESARSALSGGGGRPTTRHAFPEIIGRSRAIGEVLKLLDRAVQSQATVLIRGESGTGKELVARALHQQGPRASGPFEAVSCAALAETVLESELFGHEVGAFTGASEARQGAFMRAHGGTLFLDELQEASPKLQAELLRALETSEIRPLGGQRWRKVDVRLVAATNVDLRALVAAGTFREDLFHRVDVLRVDLPPLRERLEDLPELVRHFLGLGGQRERVLAPGVMERLMSCPWPGNVRALRNTLERAVVLAGEGPIRPEHIVIDAPRTAGALPHAGLGAAERGSFYAGAVRLNERQLALIERLRVEGEVKNADYAEQESISQPTAWRDIKDLLGKGVLTRRGQGKKTTYRLAPGWEARLQGS